MGRGSGLVWQRLHLPAPLEPDAVRAVLVGLATVSGQPRIVLEAVGRGSEVSWFIGCDATAIRRVAAVVRTHISGCRVEDVEETPHALEGSGAAICAQVRLAGSDRLPVASGEHEG